MVSSLIANLTEHLGSTSKVITETGTVVSEMLYRLWGEIRYSSGTMLTDRTYTGQRDDGAGLMDYNARMFSPRLGRFVSPDAIVPDPINPLDFDRYQYVRSNPISNVDPSGNRPCDDFDENGKCITESEWLNPIVPDPCANWEICLLAAVLMSETNRGTYSDEWMQTIAWTFLNRVTLIPGQDTLWKAVKGIQSAASCYYEVCKEGEKPIYPGLPVPPTGAELAEYWSNVYKQGASGVFGSGWNKSYNNAKKAYNNWAVFGTGSAADPTSAKVVGGATDFRMVKPNNFNSFGWPTYQDAGRPHFQYYYLGPQYISGLGQSRFMFVSNLELSNVLDVHK